MPKTKPLIEKRPEGRPTIYTPQLGEIIAELIYEGFSERKICKTLKLHRSCMSRWKHDFPEFKDQIVQARDARMCKKVERSQFKTAVGYKYNEITKEVSPEPGPDGEARMVTTKIVTKHVKPSTSAQQFILTNRNPNRWKRIEYHKVAGMLGVVTPKKAMADRLQEYEQEAEVVKPKEEDKSA